MFCVDMTTVLSLGDSAQPRSLRYPDVIQARPVPAPPPPARTPPSPARKKASLSVPSTPTQTPSPVRKRAQRAAKKTE